MFFAHPGIASIGESYHHNRFRLLDDKDRINTVTSDERGYFFPHFELRVIIHLPDPFKIFKGDEPEKTKFMKVFYGFILVLGIAGCTQPRVSPPLNMKGTYSTLITQTGTGDTLLQKEQFKMYTDHHMIYVYPQLTDSLAIYGIGTYQIRDGKVIENIFYSSINGTRKDTFTLHIDKSDKGYQQMIEYVTNYNKRYLLTEEYKKVGENVVSPLDGAWKQIRNVHIGKNGDTVFNKRITQFKLFQSGNFIWVNTYPGHAAHASKSRFGYGEFEMNGNSKLKEVNTYSTYSNLIDTPVNIELKFLSKNMYQQTIHLSNGDKYVEIYKRLN